MSILYNFIFQLKCYLKHSLSDRLIVTPPAKNHPPKKTRNPSHCHQDPTWTQSGWEFANSSLTEKERYPAQNKRADKENFRVTG